MSRSLPNRGLHAVFGPSTSAAVAPSSAFRSALNLFSLLFRLLCFAILAKDTAPSPSVGEAMHALGERGLDSVPEMAQSSEEERTEISARG